MNEYNLYKDEEYVGTYTTNELAEMFNMKLGTVWKYADEKRIYNKHYEWHKIYKAKTYVSDIDKKLMEEWDKLTEPYRNRKK